MKIPPGYKLHAFTCNGVTFFRLFREDQPPRVSYRTVQRLLGLKPNDCIMPQYISPFPRRRE
jgi:hypothetical protein